MAVIAGTLFGTIGVLAAKKFRDPRFMKKDMEETEKYEDA